jgi:hypothetical protein
MLKMGLHDPFEYLKHKLWPKEGLGIKLSIWLPTTKSQELPRFPFVQVTCHIPLESSQGGLQLCFRPHLNQRFAQDIMGLKSCGSPNFGNFGTRQNDIWVLALWLGTKNTIRGKVVASPKSGLWWVLWVHVFPWLIRAPKTFQLCTNQLIVWFVHVHVNNWIAYHYF